MAWYHPATSHYLNQCWPVLWCHIASLGHNELTWSMLHSPTMPTCLANPCWAAGLMGQSCEIMALCPSIRAVTSSLFSSKWHKQRYLSGYYATKIDSWLIFDHTDYLDELVQERRNSSALTIELRLSCTKPLICLQQCAQYLNSLRPSDAYLGK